MGNQQLNTKILLRTDTTANWTTNSSVVLLKGEVGVEILTSGKKKIKIGDSTTTWANLPYFASGEVITNSNAPTSSDYAYDVGTMWITTGNLIYVLTAVSGTTATWVQLGTSQDQNTTYDLVTSTSSSNGQINLNGSDSTTDTILLAGSNGITVTSNATGTVTITGANITTNSPTSDAGTVLSNVNLITGVTSSAQTISLTKKNLVAGANVSITAVNDGTIEIAATDTNTDTGATSIEVTGSGNAVSTASYSADTRKITLTKGLTAITGASDASVTNGLVTAIGSSGTNITSTKGIAYTTTTPSSSSTDTTLPTSKAVNSAIVTAIAENDAMTYKGTLGTSGATVSVLPTSGNRVGDTYKVITSGVYYQSTGTTTGTGDFASLGDLFIAGSTTGNWNYVPSGNDGNVYHSSSLTTGSVVIGANGDDIAVLANGTNGYVLKMVSGSPAWAVDTDTDTGATSVTVSGSGNAVSAASYDSGTRAITLTKGVTALTAVSTEAADAGTTLSNILFVAGVDPLSTSGANIVSTYRKLVAGTNVSISATSNGNITIAATDTNTTYTAATGNDLALTGTQFAVTYSKSQLVTNLNADTDVLILNGGTASSWA